MFGEPMRLELEIKGKNFGVELRPLNIDDLKSIPAGMSSLDVNRTLATSFAKTVEDEIDWYHKSRQSRTDVVWAIWLDGVDHPVGVTGLHHLSEVVNSAVSGIVLFDKSAWDKGVATRAHRLRTWYADTQLNRFTIESSALTSNEGSWKALEGVGYHRVGEIPRTHFAYGRFVDTYKLVWFNPRMIPILFPEGLPAKFREGVEKAKEILEDTKRRIKIL